MREGVSLVTAAGCVVKSEVRQLTFQESQMSHEEHIFLLLLPPSY